MKSVSLLMIAASAVAAGACGSHSPAPIVYGTQPTTTGKIYNSPTDYDRVNSPSRTARRTRSTAPVVASAAPAPLTPVTQASITTAELPPAPTYISLADPEPATPRTRQSQGLVTVQPGDTVYAIARRTGASPQAIIATNKLRAPYALSIGDTLRIPDARQKISNNITARPPVQAKPVVARARTHVVGRGDTLYSISRATGTSVAAIARANRLSPPYALSVGDRLSIPAADGRAKIQREAKASPARVEDLAKSVSYEAPANEPARMFEWPVKGAIIGEFGAGALGRRNDGVNIAAPVGTPVRAAADGEVVYRGSELDGYGNLLLIKHNDGFVTAYAHNDVMLVKKGQRINQGQVIAKVGKSGAAAEPQLHFEIRQNLKSVDPLAFLEN